MAMTGTGGAAIDIAAAGLYGGAVGGIVSVAAPIIPPALLIGYGFRKMCVFGQRFRA